MTGYSDLPPPLSHGSGWPWDAKPLVPSSRNQPSSDLPKITIVTPNFNNSRFIEATIRSVLGQNYPRLEYIVMDGGSTDGSCDIIKRYESRLHEWKSEPDRGQSHAINKGWTIATGDLVAWINSDDCLTPNALLRVAHHSAGKDDVGFIHGQATVIDERDRPIGARGRHFDPLMSLATSRNPVAQSSVFIRREALEEVGLLDETLHMSMDWDLYLRLGLRSGSFFVPEIWSLFRQAPTTKTSTNTMGFGPDKVRIVKKLDGDPASHTAIRSVRRAAYASAYVRSASGHFRGNEWALARSEMLSALRSHPAVTIASGPKRVIQVLMGGRALGSAVKIKGMLRAVFSRLRHLTNR